MRKTLIFISLLASIIYFNLSYQSWFQSGVFRIFFFDVGQGDSELIITPGGQTILIDGGPDNKVLRGLGSALPFWKRHIDLLIMTHAHDDHVTGLVEVSRRYQIKDILYNNLDFETPALEAFKKETDGKIKMTNAESGMRFEFDNNCSLSILATAKEVQVNENDYSIVSMFDCLNRKVLIGGDAGTAVEKKLLSSGLDLQADILKVSHHGSLSASSLEYLKAVSPSAAVISVGVSNTFGHPSPVILDRLQTQSIKVYRTDTQGTIEFLANNKSIKLKISGG